MSDTRAGIWVDAIPGGYRRIPTVNLCWIWSLHIRGELSRIDIRVWFALHEMAERRCMLDQGRRPRFRLGELVELLGDASEASVRAAVRRLRAAGVCVVSASRIGFPKHTKEQRESVAPMLRRMPSARRGCTSRGGSFGDWRRGSLVLSRLCSWERSSGASSSTGPRTSTASTGGCRRGGPPRRSRSASARSSVHASDSSPRGGSRSCRHPAGAWLGSAAA